MTIAIRGNLNVPNIVCLSSDVVGGEIAGAQPGMVIYYTDTKVWKIVKNDLTLADYVLPANITIAGDLEIGAVEIKDSTSDTRAVVGSYGLEVDVNRISTSVAEAISLSPLYGTQDVATPGTAEPIASSATKVIMVVIWAKSTNTGAVYVGTGAVDRVTSKQMVLQPGAAISIDTPLGYNFNLANWYVDADVANEGVDYMAMR
jgi:hypothetical protein